VGFSYADDAADYQKLGDDIDAEDMYAALISFNERYHEFARTRKRVSSSLASHMRASMCPIWHIRSSQVAAPTS